jgi:spore coat protein U-like protein
MSSHRRVAVVVGGLMMGLAPLTVAVLPASASMRPAVAPATLIATTTELKATQVPGNTPGKVIFGIKVKAASGLVPQGKVTLTVDGGTPVTLTLKPVVGRTSYTHHYKPGSHTVTASYGGSTTDAPSTVTIHFIVT